MNRAQLYHNMTTTELRDKFVNLKNELFNLRFQHTTGQLKNPLVLDTVKKDIARVLTILKEREANLPRNKGKQKTKEEKKPKSNAEKVETREAKKETKAEKKEAKPAEKKPTIKKTTETKEGGSK